MSDQTANYFESTLTPNTFWVDLKDIDFSALTGETMTLDLGPQQTYDGNSTDAFAGRTLVFLGQ